MSALRVLLAIPFLLPGAACADDVEASLQAALDAYRAGDAAAAKEEAEFAATLLGQKKAEALGAFLPGPLEGWTRQGASDGAAGARMYGGGLVSQAVYAKGGEEVTVSLAAESPMVAAMAAMFGNAAAMGAMGKVIRVQGEKAILTPGGEIQALVDGRVLVTVSGEAPEETKRMWFEAIDLAALSDF